MILFSNKKKCTDTSIKGWILNALCWAKGARHTYCMISSKWSVKLGKVDNWKTSQNSGCLGGSTQDLAGRGEILYNTMQERAVHPYAFVEIHQTAAIKIQCFTALRTKTQVLPPAKKKKDKLQPRRKYWPAKRFMCKIYKELPHIHSGENSPNRIGKRYEQAIHRKHREICSASRQSGHHKTALHSHWVLTAPEVGAHRALAAACSHWNVGTPGVGYRLTKSRKSEDAHTLRPRSSLPGVLQVVFNWMDKGDPHCSTVCNRAKREKRKASGRGGGKAN